MPVVLLLDELAPLPLGDVALGVEELGVEELDDDGLVVDVLLDVVVSVGREAEPLVDGGVDGDADGVRSVVDDSVQPPTAAMPIASAKTPVRTVFITPTSFSGVSGNPGRLWQPACPQALGLTG